MIFGTTNFRFFRVEVPIHRVDKYFFYSFMKWKKNIFSFFHKSTLSIYFIADVCICIITIPVPACCRLQFHFCAFLKICYMHCGKPQQFFPLGTIRNKKVKMWNQADAHIILNSVNYHISRWYFFRVIAFYSLTSI